MKQILLVEDEPDLLTIMESVLSANGFDVKTAASGEEALEYCGSHTPDLIVSDLVMGEMDGLALLERLHGVAKLRNIPFVFLTAASESSIMKKARELGAAGYFTKPIDLEEFLRFVRQMLPSV
jgi:CheY-like chemotaxis protein